MGQKTSPILLRLGLNQSWQSDWYPYKNSGAIGARANNYFQNLHQDLLARTYLDIVYTKLRAPTMAHNGGQQSADFEDNAKATLAHKPPETFANLSSTSSATTTKTDTAAATGATKGRTILARVRQAENWACWSTHTTSTFCCAFDLLCSRRDSKKNKSETKPTAKNKHKHNGFFQLDIKLILFLMKKLYVLRKNVNSINKTILEFAWKTAPFVVSQPSGADSCTKHAAFMHTRRRNYCRRKQRKTYLHEFKHTPGAFPAFDPFVEEAESAAGGVTTIGLVNSKKKAMGPHPIIKQRREAAQFPPAASLLEMPLSMRLRLMRLHNRKRTRDTNPQAHPFLVRANKEERVWERTPALPRTLKLWSPEIDMREVTDFLSKLYWIKYKSGIHRTLAKKNLYYAKTKAFSLMMALLLRRLVLLDPQPQNAGRNAKNPQVLPSSSRDALTYAQKLVFDGLASSWMENILPVLAGREGTAIADGHVRFAPSGEIETKPKKQSPRIVPTSALSSFAAKGWFPLWGWRRKLLSLAIWRRFLFKMGEQEQWRSKNCYASVCEKTMTNKHAKKKRNKAYKHFILNTVIKSLSNAIYTKFDKGPRVNDLGYSIAQANLLCLSHKGTNLVLDNPLDLYACIYKRIMAHNTVPSSANGSRWDSRSVTWRKLEDICFGGFVKNPKAKEGTLGIFSEFAISGTKPRTYQPDTSSVLRPPTFFPGVVDAGEGISAGGTTNAHTLEGEAKNVPFVRTPAGRTLFPRQRPLYLDDAPSAQAGAAGVFQDLELEAEGVSEPNTPTFLFHQTLYVQHTLEIFCALSRNLNVYKNVPATNNNDYAPAVSAEKGEAKKKATPSSPDVLSWVPLQKGLENLNLLTYLYYLYEWNRPAMLDTLNDSVSPINKTVTPTEGSYNRTYWDHHDEGPRLLTDPIYPHPFVFADVHSDKIFGANTLSGNFVIQSIRKSPRMSLGRKTSPIFFRLVVSNNKLAVAKTAGLNPEPKGTQKNASDTHISAHQTAESAAKTASQKNTAKGNRDRFHSSPQGLRRRKKLVSLGGARQYFIKKSRNTLSIDIHTRVGVPKGRKHPDRAAFCTMLLQQRFAKTHEPSPNQQRSETNSPGQLLPRQTTTQHLIRLSSTVFSPKQTQRTAYITKPRKASRHTLQRILGRGCSSSPRPRMRMLVVFGKGVEAKPTPLLSSCGDLEKKRIKAGAERFHLAGIRLRLHIFGGINTQPAMTSKAYSDPGRKWELADILRLQSPKQHIPFLLQEATPLLCHASRKANINAAAHASPSALTTAFFVSEPIAKQQPQEVLAPKTKSAHVATDFGGGAVRPLGTIVTTAERSSSSPKPRTRCWSRSKNGVQAMNKNIYAPCPSLNWGTYPLAFRGDSVLEGGAQLRPTLSSLPFVSPGGVGTATASRNVLSRSSLHLSVPFRKSSKHQVQENGRHFFLSAEATGDSVRSRARESARAFQDFSESPQFGIIIKHHHSKSYNASFLVQNLSKFVIAFLKKNRGAKNKFQQLKNIASRILVASTSSASSAAETTSVSSYFIDQHLAIGDGTKKPNGPLSPFFDQDRFDAKMQETSLPNAVSPSKGSGAYGIRKKKNNHRGVAFRFAGRAYGAKKAASFKMLVGSTPFNTLRTNMDYAQVTQKTRNGTWGFKIWLNLGRKNTINVLSLLGTRRISSTSASSRSVHTQTLAKAFAKKKTL
uniref:30S ribosomal protein S3 n=1 Tax=Marophrys sp. SRT127 TaxID=2488311 RepID=A0A455REM8_9EUKA|nr:30S ribosomal protein S3 [Marophrys sp. SRT127]